MEKQICLSNNQQGQPHAETKAGAVMFLYLLVLQGDCLLEPPFQDNVCMYFAGRCCAVGAEDEACSSRQSRGLCLPCQGGDEAVPFFSGSNMENTFLLVCSG